MQPIRAQTGSDQQITVNADSLYQVFMNYEKCKVIVRGLKIDTLNMRMAIKAQDTVINNQREALGYYQDVMIPKYQELEIIHQEEKKAIIKKARRKRWMNAIIFVAGGIILGSQVK